MLNSCFASTCCVRVAARTLHLSPLFLSLCLHVPRAGCDSAAVVKKSLTTLCLHAPRVGCNVICDFYRPQPQLCLHVPCADCDGKAAQSTSNPLMQFVLSAVDSFSIMIGTNCFPALFCCRNAIGTLTSSFGWAINRSSFRGCIYYTTLLIFCQCFVWTQ